MDSEETTGLLQDDIITEGDIYNTDCYFKANIPLIDLIETYQGEGPNCGKKMVLTRFKYCNKLCPFCDTQKMMNELNTTMYSMKDIAVMLTSSPNLMITGGEPTLQKPIQCKYSQLTLTLAMLKYLSYDFADVETNGLNIIPLIDRVNLNTRNPERINISWSPKFITPVDYTDNISKLEDIISRDLDNNKYRNKSTHKDTCKTIIKIVIGEDLDMYKRFIYEAVLNYRFDRNRVYLMPKGTNMEEINNSMKHVLDVASELGCNISSRLHVIHNFQ